MTEMYNCIQISILQKINIYMISIILRGKYNKKYINIKIFFIIICKFLQVYMINIIVIYNIY